MPKNLFYILKRHEAVTEHQEKPHLKILYYLG
jgi:hypothetical protein